MKRTLRSHRIVFSGSAFSNTRAKIRPPSIDPKARRDSVVARISTQLSRRAMDVYTSINNAIGSFLLSRHCVLSFFFLRKSTNK